MGSGDRGGRLSTFAVILAGGKGARFWPAGRRARPKQLLRIAGERTMLEETLRRCAPLAPPERTFVVTNTLQEEPTRRVAGELGGDEGLVEPLMRNTAAAIGLAALHVRRIDPEGVMLILPADHVIRPPERFLSTFRAAARRAAEQAAILVVGVLPSGPATGYGYIEAGDVVAEVEGYAVHAVARFKEKPDAARAQELLQTGRTWWTFVVSAPALMQAFEEHLPGHARILAEIDERLGAGEAAPEETYRRLENVPFDIGVVERARNVEVIPADFDWDDVGSWLALGRIHPRDEQGNVVRGRHAALDTRNCILISDHDHLLATIGLEDAIVVHTPDATLICRRARAEDVRRLVEQLGEEGLEEYL
ncbi:MAG: mannose-1-phosphate guanylyltransferase [Planctomycetota bacterium]